MPSFEELENPRSNIATEIYSEDGKVLGTFFVQNRSYVQYEELFASDSVDVYKRQVQSRTGVRAMPRRKMDE